MTYYCISYEATTYDRADNTCWSHQARIYHPRMLTARGLKIVLNRNGGCKIAAINWLTHTPLSR